MRVISSSYSAVLFLALWWVLFVVLSVFSYNEFQVLNVVGFLALVIIPGTLVSSFLPLPTLLLWPRILLTIAFSLLILMIVPLLGNEFLPFFGISKPLAKEILLIELSVVVFALIGFSAFRKTITNTTIHFRTYFPTLRDWCYAFLPVLFVALSVFGAIRLNNQENGVLTLCMLGLMAVYAVLLARKIHTLHENVPGTALFFMALSLLLMTSLRGWFITGHDVQWEYKVFQLADRAGIWDMATYRDAYNACLSITILPTVFSNTLSLFDPYIFKVLYQILFAITPVIAYHIAGRWLLPTLAFFSGLFFMSFPTFFEDMPFLARQEIAFIFYAAMLYLVFEDRLSLNVRRVLFLVMGLGVILSHYSTTYTILIVLGIAVVGFRLFRAVFLFLHRRGWFHESALTTSVHGVSRPRITFSMLLILAGMSFLWTSTVTETSGHLRSVIGETIHAIQNGFTESSRSTDARSFFSFSRPSQEAALQEYADTFVEPLRQEAPQFYFSKELIAQYPLTILDEQTMPLTTVGAFLTENGVPARPIVSTLGKILSKLMQVLVVVGIIYTLCNRRLVRHIDVEHFIIASACLIFVALNILLPVLSTEYGVFRALQQSLFMIGIFLVIGGVVFVGALGRGIARILRLVKVSSSAFVSAPFLEWGMIALTMLFFLQATAFLPHLIGENAPPLHLANQGSYYDYYMTHRGNVEVMSWLKDEYAKQVAAGTPSAFELQADKYAQNKIVSLSTLPYSHGTFPLLVKNNSYLYLDVVVVTKNRAAVGHGGDFITYAYPMEFLEKNKDLIYSNGSVSIFK